MQTIKVNTTKPYKIIIEKGLLSRTGEEVRQVTAAKKAVIITDSNVAPLYAKTVAASLENCGFKTAVFVLPAGEENKNIAAIEGIYNFLAENGCNRKDVLVALGGGVTGDLAGFAAATYMRGIDLVQIPTTLLAQTDSSVGGKTGFNLTAGKNLAGAFWQPKLVIIDPNTLNTLTAALIADGMAEVIKYGCIKNADFLQKLLALPSVIDAAEEIITECVQIKADIVAADEFESGQRMLLNFGHTLGHAVEKLSDYSGCSHGQAVAIGMVQIARLAENAGLTKPGTADLIEKLCLKFGLPIASPYKMQELLGTIALDKKSDSKGINFVLLKKPGEAFVKNFSFKQTEDFLLNAE